MLMSDVKLKTYYKYLLMKKSGRNDFVGKPSRIVSSRLRRFYRVQTMTALLSGVSRRFEGHERYGRPFRGTRKWRPACPQTPENGSLGFLLSVCPQAHQTLSFPALYAYGHIVELTRNRPGADRLPLYIRNGPGRASRPEYPVLSPPNFLQRESTMLSCRGAT